MRRAPRAVADGRSVPHEIEVGDAPWERHDQFEDSEEVTTVVPPLSKWPPFEGPELRSKEARVRLLPYSGGPEPRRQGQTRKSH